MNMRINFSDLLKIQHVVMSGLFGIGSLHFSESGYREQAVIEKHSTVITNKRTVHLG